MSDNSKIEWCDASWNPIRAWLKSTMIDVPPQRWGYHCERVSPGCKNCYAATMNGRMLPAWGTGLDYTVPNREKVEIFLDEKELLKPLRWKKPRRIFVESMSDWCATFATDEMRDRIMAVAALCPQHTFLFLTKRAKECAEYFDKHRTLCSSIVEFMDIGKGTVRSASWINPLSNVHLGFSAENQECFDERWSHMRKLAAAGWKVWASIEPMLGPVDISYPPSMYPPVVSELHQVVVGGESGPGARPMDIGWVRSILRQCAASRTAAFVKQIGAKPYSRTMEPWTEIKKKATLAGCVAVFPKLKNRKGGDPSEWPEDLRVRQYPEAQ